ncbi:MAG: type II toxin-antitoxin system VapC family toxin [Deltaproteobacteria bacterium]|nr:type II toxin-antitoxin system VapC family toxin [Deltaproteobacteria bacterium]
MRYVLDTTAFSAAMRREEAILDFFRAHRPKQIVTVPPVVAEIYYGIERLDHLARKYYLLKSELDRLLAIIDVLPWLFEASYNFGIIKADLETRGAVIADFDIAISAIAMAHECTVVTANLDHFSRIKRLNCRFWK